MSLRREKKSVRNILICKKQKIFAQDGICLQKRYKLLVKDRKYLHNIKTVFNKTETICEDRKFFSNCKRENIYKRLLVKHKKRFLTDRNHL